MMGQEEKQKEELEVTLGVSRSLNYSIEPDMQTLCKHT